MATTVVLIMRFPWTFSAEAGYTFGINKVDEHNGLLTAEKAPK